jgi:hypothetical protein
MHKKRLSCVLKCIEKRDGRCRNLTPIREKRSRKLFRLSWLVHEPVAAGHTTKNDRGPAAGGFLIERIRGSHHFLRHKDDPTRRTVVALHSGDVPQELCAIS